MEELSSLAKLDNATRMLAEIRTIDDAKQLINLAEAARVYARQIELGLEAQNHAAEIKLRAQRRAGEILEKMEGSQGVRTDLTFLPPEKKLKMEQYGEIGINGKDAHTWKTIAAMPEDKFEEVIAATKGEDKELSTSGIYRAARFEAGKIDKVQPPELNGKYRIIYADPPWKYGDAMGIPGYKVSAEMHYPVMSIPELCSLQIQNIAEDDAVLFLWTTSPLLYDSFAVITAWGFEYKTSFVWDKVGHNFGHYNSVRHEFLLVCTRGSCAPDNLKLFDSVQTIEKSDRHSEKPEEFRNIIDTLYTHGKRIELFARKQVEGWEVWGNESTNN